jgi:Demerecviridae HNH endonuclease
MNAERVRELFDYDASSGKLRWRVGRRAGLPAGGKTGNGYVQLVLGKDRKGYYAHRLIWLWVYGKWPPEIDHINGDKTDNRLINLRLATRSQNMANARSSEGKSGFRGVSLDKRNLSNPWIAHIYKDRRKRHLGSYPTPELAHAAYCEAAQAMHGEFMRRE